MLTAKMVSGRPIVSKILLTFIVEVLLLRTKPQDGVTWLNARIDNKITGQYRVTTEHRQKAII